MLPPLVRLRIGGLVFFFCGFAIVSVFFGWQMTLGFALLLIGTKEM